MNKSEKWGKSFKICDVTQLGPNLKNMTKYVFLSFSLAPSANPAQ